MRYSSLFFVSFLIAFAAQGQDCLSFKDGAILNLKIMSYTNPLLSDQKFLKAKEEKKEEQVAKYNEDVISGKIQPNAFPMAYTAKKTEEDGGTSYLMYTTIAGKEYFSRAFCKGDTLYQYRTIEPTKLEVNGEILGYNLQGVQKIPLSLKVGDRLPSYEDIGFTLPKTTEKKASVRVFSHNATSEKKEVSYYQSGDHLMEKTVTTTKTYPVYNDIEAVVRETLSYSNHIIHYMNAFVTGREKISFAGTEYDAFVIESESWAKGALNSSYESANQMVADEQKKMMEVGQEALHKIMHKKFQFTNALGYLVSYKKEWFVPTIGMVKTQHFDSFGGISGEILLDSVK